MQDLQYGQHTKWKPSNKWPKLNKFVPDTKIHKLLAGLGKIDLIKILHIRSTTIYYLLIYHLDNTFTALQFTQ